MAIQLTEQQPTCHVSPATCHAFTSALTAIGGFEHHPTVAVAVSGGADSVALTLLAHEWIKRKGGRLVALTVDHGLRPESAQEARQVHDWCDVYGIEHHTLRIQDSEFRIQEKIQEQAREARYQLLAQWCRERHILHLMTAHHQGDQAETLFFRLSRGSGIDGLACISPLSVTHGVRLLRPLLGVSKARLQALLTECGQAWIDDPSNRNLHYTRNRIRHYIDQSQGNEVLPLEACRLTASFGKIRNLLENKLASFLTNTVSLFPEGYAAIDYELFLELPPEFGLRTLAAVAITLNGAAYPYRSEKLERLYNDIVAGDIRRRTFAGLLFIHQPAQQRLLVCRELDAAQGPLLLERGKTLLWDWRFRAGCHSADKQEPALYVRALGYQGVRLLETLTDKGMQPARKPRVPNIVMAGLPSFWYLEEVAAVPHIKWINSDYGNMGCSSRFCPAKPLAGPAFFSMNT